MRRRAGLFVGLFLVAGSAFASPASAQLSCPDTSLVTTPGTALTFTAPTCANAVGPVAYMEVTPPGSGMATYGAQFSFTPTPGFHGRDTYVYQGFDGGVAPDNGTISVLVDTKPTCTSGTATVAANSSVQVPVTCADADGDMFTYELGAPANGTVALQGTQYIYTPKAGFTGTDSFTYRAKDTFDLTADNATISVTVTAAPAATPTDMTAPTIALKNASKKQALSITVTSNEAGSATFTAALDRATAKKLKLSRTVGTLKRTLKAGTATLKIKLSSKAAKAFKKRKSVKLTVTAVVTDAAGNKTTKTLKVTLKR